MELLLVATKVMELLLVGLIIIITLVCFPKLTNTITGCNRKKPKLKQLLILACVMWVLATITLYLLTLTDYQSLARKVHAGLVVLSVPALSIALGYLLLKISSRKRDKEALTIIIIISIYIFLVLVPAIHKTPALIQDLWSGQTIQKEGVSIVRTSGIRTRGVFPHDPKIYFSDDPKTAYRYWGGATLYNGEIVDVTAMPTSKEILEIKKR